MRAHTHNNKHIGGGVRAQRVKVLAVKEPTWWREPTPELSSDLLTNEYTHTIHIYSERQASQGYKDPVSKTNKPINEI